MLPFRLGASTEFAAVRAALAAAGYTEPAVCERIGIETIYRFRTVAQGREPAPRLDDALDVLVRLFLDGLPVRADAVHRLLPAGGADALRALGLLGVFPAEPDHYAASVLLYPTAGLYLVSDLDRVAPGLRPPDELEPPDHVFSAITSLTGAFLAQLPGEPCGRFLELCAGTGIAALVTARSAAHVWALDITERATRFAEFNARLNGVANLTALQGDLFEPVLGLQFERIVAHPPYVPATETRLIYRDAGEDGEDVLRRMLAALPDHLSPGGRFYCTCTATDRRAAPLEQRIRQMLGEREAEFDVLLVTQLEMHPTEYYCRHAASGRVSFALAEERHQLFRRLEAERMVHGSFVLQRHTAPRAAFTLRRRRSERADSAASEALLRWRTTIAEQDVLPWLVEARPRLSPHARLQVLHRVEGADWALESCTIRVEHPFVRELELSLNASRLLTLCDGSLTSREILQRLQAAGAMPEAVPERAFAEFIRELLTEGILTLAEAPAEAGVPSALAADAAPAWH